MTTSSTDPEGFFQVLCSHLRRCGIEFMLTGSFVSSYYGDPRTTRDLDLIVNAQEPPDDAMKQFVGLCLADGYYVSEQSALGPISEGRRQFNVISGTSGWKADLMWVLDRPFSVSEFSRRTVISILGIDVPVPTPEDIVLAKLEWGGSTESRQFDDLVSVIRVTDQAFDLPYTRLWATELGVRDLLEAAISQARHETKG